MCDCFVLNFLRPVSKAAWNVTQFVQCKSASSLRDFRLFPSLLGTLAGGLSDQWCTCSPASCVVLFSVADDAVSRRNLWNKCSTVLQQQQSSWGCGRTLGMFVASLNFLISRSDGIHTSRRLRVFCVVRILWRGLQCGVLSNLDCYSARVTDCLTFILVLKDFKLPFVVVCLWLYCGFVKSSSGTESNIFLLGDII